MVEPPQQPHHLETFPLSLQSLLHPPHPESLFQESLSLEQEYTNFYI
jgi:hypothetical protein